MSYQHGYQQQPQQPPQQPYGGYQGGGGYPDSSDSTNPAMAIIAAVLALAAAAALVVASFSELDLLGVGFGDLPGEWQTIMIVRGAAALVLLVGAILVFARKMAGAILVVLGGLAGIAAVLLYPVILDASGKFGDYLELLFKFEVTFLTFSVIALIASPLALIFAILPPTLNYLKGSGSSSDFGGYPQQPQQGW